jgi:hypothetical protein
MVKFFIRSKIPVETRRDVLLGIAPEQRDLEGKAGGIT